MYLSKIVFEPRRVAALRLLSDLYRQHRFVLSAFPDRESEGIATELPRQENKPFVLYRTETADNDRHVFLLAQSEQEPDWERVSGMHSDMIATHCTKKIEPAFMRGQTLRFRLRANPTRVYVNGDITIRANHKRAGLYKDDEQIDWLERHAERSGFRVASETLLLTSRGVLRSEKPPASEGQMGHSIKCLAVDFDGLLTVTDSEKFLSAFQSGIGRGKAWGCGLLSVARV